MIVFLLFLVLLFVYYLLMKFVVEWISQQGYGGDGKVYQWGEVYLLCLFVVVVCVNGSLVCFVCIVCNIIVLFVLLCFFCYVLFVFVWVFEFVVLVQGGMVEFVVRFMVFVGCYFICLVVCVVVFCGGDEWEMSVCGLMLCVFFMFVLV